MKKLLFCFLFIPLFGTAQREGTIQTDRVGEALSPLTIGKNYLQIQSGYLVSRIQQITVNDETARGMAGNWQLRYGLTRKSELNIGVIADRRDVEALPIGNVALVAVRRLPGYSSGLHQADIGFRHNFFTASERAFNLGLLVSSSILINPFNSRFDYLVGRAMLLGSTDIGSKVYATGNIGFNWAQQVNVPDFVYLVNFKFDMGRNVGLYVETRNDLSLSTNGPGRGQLGSGVIWRFAPNFQFDLGGGWWRENNFGLIYNQWYLTTGFSWKIKALPNKPNS
jgi:hypothetical protein